jgi:hypothetical protein
MHLMLPKRFAVQKLEVLRNHGQCCTQIQMSSPTSIIPALSLTETAGSSLHVEPASQGSSSGMNVQEKASDCGMAVEKQIRPLTRQKDDLVGIGSMFR